MAPFTQLAPEPPIVLQAYAAYAKLLLRYRRLQAVNNLSTLASNAPLAPYGPLTSVRTFNSESTCAFPALSDICCCCIFYIAVIIIVKVTVVAIAMVVAEVAAFVGTTFRGGNVNLQLLKVICSRAFHVYVYVST